MLKQLKSMVRYLLKIAIASTPLLIAMYLLYWLGKHEIWVPETPHRDKITIAIMVVGMVLSLFVQSYLAKRGKK